MAEAKDDEPTFPRKGKVQEVRKQWAVHEDGALAYQIQNEEIDQHYGMNRYNRRLVREDIPVAKIVQSEEEILRQQERLKELAILKAMAEEDEKVAKRIAEQLKHEKAKPEANAALDDEELARQLQEKEKKRYERHLERKREKKLKQERQLLEEQLARDTEAARLALSSDGASERLTESVENLNGVSRVTPSGRIEDDGDFSDFYNLPDEMDEFTRLEIQASQDEELARLLQEQEHKRSKAEVDQDKLRQIEQQDEQLARVMQEQEKLRLKKAKLKHQQKKEAQRKQAAESLPLGASANTLHLQQLSDSPPPPNTTSGSGHNRYRRNSYTQAFDSPPSPPHSQPPARSASDKSSQVHSQGRDAVSSHGTSSALGSVHNQQYSKAQHQMAPPLVSPMSSPRSAYIGPGGGGMSTLESARRIAAGDHERILALQNSSVQQQLNVLPARNATLQERSGSANTMDIIRAHGQQSNSSRNGSRGTESRSHLHSSGKISPDVYSHQHQHNAPHGEELRSSESAEVLKWLGSQEEEEEAFRRQQHQIGRSASGSYYTDEEESPPHVSYPNGSAGFNIAAAIDPTYQRRHPEAALGEEAHRLKSHVPFSLSLPQADGELEWDPGLRGSLRKTKAPIHGYQDSSGLLSQPKVVVAGGEPVMSVWQPVQGQRRGELKSRNKARKQNSAGSDKKDKSNCKQQ
uniref:Coiled-coil domain-containing protein n=1 Tax=Biomphalaria glabrata TaxID=6526 RepID=A0A2C9LLI6_BIOGL